MRPAAIRFWNASTITISGIEITTEAALIVPSGTSNWVAPVKNAIATGTVRADGEDVSVTAEQELVPGEDEREDARGGPGPAPPAESTIL